MTRSTLYRQSLSKVALGFLVSYSATFYDQIKCEAFQPHSQPCKPSFYIDPAVYLFGAAKAKETDRVLVWVDCIRQKALSQSSICASFSSSVTNLMPFLI